jgi:hypothetical protein
MSLYQVECICCSCLNCDEDWGNRTSAEGWDCWGWAFDVVGW